MSRVVWFAGIGAIVGGVVWSDLIGLRGFVTDVERRLAFVAGAAVGALIGWTIDRLTRWPTDKKRKTRSK
jgi:hypothetical protein